jgi:TPP-dependent pyruvate/acetoin dehydrogenase alpha subunit
VQNGSDGVAERGRLEEIDISGYAHPELIEWLEEMVLIREFEDVLVRAALAGKVPGGLHAAVGQEAVAVGVIHALEPDDVVASGHRPHHHALAKGLDRDAIMAELYGRATGCAGGRGGTMHLAAFDLGYFGGNGIVGSGFGIAMGAALAAKMRDTGQVAVGFFGDGGANTGRVWESINLAAIWALPMIAVCENNLYAVETSFRRVFAGESVAKRAEGFGLPAQQVDGQDVCAVHRAATAAIERARRGEGPSFIEALTYRYQGHMSGEVVDYRTVDEVEEWRETRDPIMRLQTALIDAGALDADAPEAILANAQRSVEASTAFADGSPYPDVASAASDILSSTFDARS